MKPAELRRSYEELVDAHRLLEAENQKLRAELERLRGGAPRVVSAQVQVEKPVDAGSLVNYVDPRGLEHAALVLKKLDGDRLRVKVFRPARPDLVLDVVRAVSSDQRNCWRRHGEK